MNSKNVIIGSTLVLWALFLLILASPSIIGANGPLFALLPLVALMAFWASILSAIILVKGLSDKEAKNEHFTHTPLAKVIAFLLVACIVVSTTTAIKSLWIGFDSSKFVFQNIATGTLFAAIVLTFVLSTLQKHIYWLKLGKNLHLDERQLQERQQVFETSYKLGALLVIIAAGEFAGHLHSITTIMAQPVNALSGHLKYPAYNLVVTMFALPLVVAAWRKR